MLYLLALLPLAFAAPTRRATGQTIAAADGLCLSLANGYETTPSNGVAIQSVHCIQASLWDISKGSGSILLSGTNFAIDAGSNPGDHGSLKIWQSYPGLYQQTWYFTDDNRIAITGGNQCMDEGVNGIQTYQCTTGNRNQAFEIDPSLRPSSSVVTQSPATQTSTSPSAPTNIAPYIPQGSVYPAIQDAHRIFPYGRTDLSLTVEDTDFTRGSPVAISYDLANDNSAAGKQFWNLTMGVPGPIKIGGYCLDAGENPENGSGLKIWDCYEGLEQQTWTINSDLTFSLGNGQCLDIVSGSHPQNGQLSVQTWACSANRDPYQKFSINLE